MSQHMGTRMGNYGQSGDGHGGETDKVTAICQSLYMVLGKGKFEVYVDEMKLRTNTT